MKKFKKLIPAMVMLLIATMLMGTTTYAWFSMNNKVTVTGMEIRTKVSNNLFVASKALNTTTVEADSAFNSYLNYTTAAALLEPVSTIDGLNFFYTDSATNVAAGGAVRTANYTALNTSKAAPTTEQLTAFRTANGTANSVGYADYVMELKAVNADSNATTLKLTKLDLVYKGLPTSEKAYRVAVFMEKFNGTAYTIASEATLPAASSIFSKSGATNFTSGSAVNSTAGVGTVLTPNATISQSVAANSTEYYKVVVRIWLEGEDNTCNNETFAALNQNWALDLAFELGTATEAVANIGTTALTSSASGATGSVTLTGAGALSNGEIPATSGAYQWYNAANGTAVDGATSATYTLEGAAGTTGVFFCKVTTTKGNVYYTDGMTLTVPNS